MNISDNYLDSHREQGHAHELAPSVQRNLGPAVALFGQLVRSAYASDSGELAIVFADDRVMNVRQDPQYEAWEFSGPRGVRIVCAPGGELAVWQRKDDAQGTADG
jgi:hypothetical protein